MGHTVENRAVKGRKDLFLLFFQEVCVYVCVGVTSYLLYTMVTTFILTCVVKNRKENHGFLVYSIN